MLLRAYGSKFLLKCILATFEIRISNNVQREFKRMVKCFFKLLNSYNFKGGTSEKHRKLAK